MLEQRVALIDGALSTAGPTNSASSVPHLAPSIEEHATSLIQLPAHDVVTILSFVDQCALAGIGTP
jgi:hypothetical protein